MEIESAARRHIMRDPTVAGYVAGKVFKFRLEEPVETTGGRAVVVNRGAGWAGRDPVQSQEYPRLVVDCYADPTRTETKEIATLDAEDKAYALAGAVSRLFAFPQLRSEWMGGVGSNPGLFVISSQPWGEPQIIRGGDFHPPRSGDTVFVRVEFALQVVHGE